MATRALIGKIIGSNKAKLVYSHWDGYPKHVGRVLVEHFDEIKTDKLLSLGSVSVLAPEIGEKHGFNDVTHEEWCKFYGRDRGDENVDAFEIEDETDFISALVAAAKQRWAEFVYLFQDGEWHYLNVSSDVKDLVLLTPEITGAND